jgi:hypothetical protein
MCGFGGFPFVACLHDLSPCAALAPPNPLILVILHSSTVITTMLTRLASVSATDVRTGVAEFERNWSTQFG